MNLLIIWWILCQLLVNVTALDGGCINDNIRICQCFNSSQTTHSIECCGDKIMRLSYSPIYELTNSSCKPSNSTSLCLTRGHFFTLNHEDRVPIYNSCSGKKRCNITVHPSGNIKIQFPVYCEPATKILTFIEKSSSNFTNTTSIFHIAGKDHIGKQISYSCIATNIRATGYLYLYVFYIHLGSKSCGKVKIYAKGVPTFGLGCTDSGVTMFYRYAGRVGKEFRLEIKDLELEKNEIIYLRLSAGRSKISVHCHGNLKDTTETPTIPSTTNGETTIDSTTSVTEKSKMVDGEGDEVNPYVLFGGILAALIIINIVCIIGVYCFLRNRKRPKETTINMALSDRKGKNSDNNYVNIVDSHRENNSGHSHYNYVDIDEVQVTKSNNNYGHISKSCDTEVYHELEIEDKKTTNEKSSNYDHIVGNRLPSRDGTPVCKSDNYDHIKSTSLQAVINDPYNHIGEDIHDSDHNGIKAKGHNPPASKSSDSNQMDDDDTYNHLNK